MQAESKQSLMGKTILVTRPDGFTDKLCKLIEAAGAQALHIPAIKIEEIDKNKQESTKNLLCETDNLYAIIFVSRNAITFALELVPDLNLQYKGIQLIAAGPATARTLSEKGFSNVLYPDLDSGSESLLMMDVLGQQKVKDKNIMIVRGVGGRELLRQTLEQRGASVNYVEVYKRVMPEYDHKTLNKAWSESPPDCIIITSIEGLDNLMVMTENSFDIYDIPMAVMSDRIKQYARKIGFKSKLQIAESATDESILEAIIETIQV